MDNIILIRCNDEKQMAEQLAKQKGFNISQLIRQLIRQEYEKELNNVRYIKDK